MRRIGWMGACVALLVVGCGSESQFDVFEEPPGSNCPAGGYRIEADGVVFYSCDGNATAVPVAAGEDGNTCIGDAVRVTIPVAGSTPRVLYVCQATAPADPELVAMFTRPLEVQLAVAEVMCVCNEDGEMCGSYLALYESLQGIYRSCLNDVLNIVGPPPADFAETFDCQFGGIEEALECFEAIELPTECTEETEMALQEDYEACTPEVQPEECDPPSEETEQWGSTLTVTAQFMNCPLMLSGAGAI